MTLDNDNAMQNGIIRDLTVVGVFFLLFVLVYAGLDMERQLTTVDQ